MPLEPGTTLGPYTVTAKIGEGGMGEVYRATDTKLDRDVALKVLPEAFTADPDRLARFEREAKVLASLNHPNIGTIYGLEEAEGVKALVLELIEGPTLADRIKQGPIPVDEALPIARQIAEALEAAHEQGIVHRDLKPANIKVRSDGTVKVLDFGLAKALAGDAEAADLSQSPTMTASMGGTREGVILGTAAYMSPEQARGRPLDKRTDIWAFGCVLFEMLTGRSALGGETLSDTIAGILEREPEWGLLPAGVPPGVATYLRRCFERDPKRRVRDIGDVRLAMEGAFETTDTVRGDSATVQPFAAWQRPMSIAATVLAAVALGGLAVWGFVRPAVVPADLVRFRIVPPETAALNAGGFQSDLMISPDGTLVVYVGRNAEGMGPQLYLRRIDQLDSAPLRGGEDGVGPVVSPDGAWVGFVDGQTQRRLQKVSIFGGSPVSLTEAGSSIRGITWGADDQILFGTDTSGLYRVSGGGGAAEPLTTPDSEQGERDHRWPSLIPEREAVVFVIAAFGGPLNTGQLAVLDLATGAVTRLGLAGVSPRYLSTGHLVYATEDGSVRAVPFDAASLTVTGNPVPLVEGVAVKLTGAANFSVSDNVRLVYASGTAGGRLARSLLWVNREGRETPIPAPVRAYAQARVSPDGTRVLVDARDQEQDLWVWTLPDGPLTRLTFDAGADSYGNWTPTGDRIVFSSTRGGRMSVWWKAADGTGVAERVGGSENSQWVTAVTPDGTRVIARSQVPDREVDLVVLPLAGDSAPETLVGTPFSEANAALSPDGAWVAYQSDESGTVEVYVRPFPDATASRTLVSTVGGSQPVWAPDGSELFYLEGTQLMAVPVQTETGFPYGSPERLFDAPYYFESPGRNYDVAPDGRFLMIKDTDQLDGGGASPAITVVLNWHQELLQRVPIP